MKLYRRARVEADNHIRAIMFSSPSRLLNLDTAGLTTPVRSSSESHSSDDKDAKESKEDSAKTRTESRQGGSTGSSSWMSTLGNKLVDTIDNSVLGVKIPHEQQQVIRRSNSSGSMSTVTKPTGTKRVTSGYESESGVDAPKNAVHVSDTMTTYDA